MNGCMGAAMGFFNQRWSFLVTAPALLLAAMATAQDSAPEQSLDRGIELLRQMRPAEAEQLFSRLVDLDKNNARAQYYLALSRSQQGRLEEARTGFEQVLRIDPGNADARFEIAGIYIKTREYSVARSWAKRGLQLSPRDEYGLDLAGTASFLMDDKIQALRYWNRLNRPHLTEIQINPADFKTRQRIAEEIHLVPGDLLSAHEIDAARWRIRQHRYVRAVNLQPLPGPVQDQYALQVDADIRRGVGSRTEFLFNTLSNIGFQTWRLTWWNIAGIGLTSDLLLRWRADAQRYQLAVDMPRPGHLPFYSGVSYVWRDESWRFSEDSGQPKPGFRLRMHETSVKFLLPLRIPELSITAAAAARRRSFDAQEITQTVRNRLVPQAATDGTSEVNECDSSLDTAHRSFWFRLAPVLLLHGNQSQSAAGFESRIRAEAGVGRAWDPIEQRLSRFSVSWENRFDWISRTELQRTLLLGLHAGQLSAPGLVEDHFILGVGPDADFWLRAHPFLRHGKPGQTPLAGKFLLGNLTIASDIKRFKWIKLGALAFLDFAQLPRAYSGQTLPRILADAGVGIELGSPIVPGRRFTVTWGHDTRTGRSVFYLATSFR